MTTIGTIGAGHIGQAVATLARDTGHEVILSNSRGPDTLVDVAAAIGEHTRPGTRHEAAHADLVVLTIPFGHVRDLPCDLLDDRVVIDTTNYYPERDGVVAELDAGRTTTSGLVARHLAGAHVVKSLSSIVHSHLVDLARPTGSPDRSALPVASDDEDAKARVVRLLDDLGYDALDAGPLAQGWRFERGRPAYCQPYAADQVAMAASRPGHRPEGTRRVTAAELGALLARASR